MPNRNVRYGCRLNRAAATIEREKSVLLANADIDNSQALTERQKAVLDAALRLLVEEGDGLTMTAVARRASCSKETLYKWFGDRDGLLTATVQWQAAKVRVPPVDGKALDPAVAAASIEQLRARTG